MLNYDEEIPPDFIGGYASAHITDHKFGHHDNRSLNTTLPYIYEEEWLAIKKVADFADYLLISFSLPGLLAHIFVLWSSQRLFSTSRDPTHLLVASMTFADLLICITHQLRILVTHLKFLEVHGHSFLVIHMILAWTGYSASGFSLFLLNIEKLLYFHWPLHYETVVTPKKTLSVISVTWTVCTLYTILQLVTAQYWCDNQYCIVPNYTVFHYYIILFSILPALSSGFLSIYLWCTVKSKRQDTSTKVTPRQQLRTMVFIFTTTGWVVVSWIPARLYFIFFLESTDLVLSWVGFGANYLLLLNPILSPILTIIAYPCYRHLLINCYKCLMKKSNSFYLPVEIETMIENANSSTLDNSPKSHSNCPSITETQNL